MSLKSSLSKAVSAIAITTLATTGCVEERGETKEDIAALEAIENILEEIHNACRRSPSDVDDFVCELTLHGEPAATVSLGCWSGNGWASEPEDLESHYDQFDVEEDCEVIAAQW